MFATLVLMKKYPEPSLMNSSAYKNKKAPQIKLHLACTLLKLASLPMSYSRIISKIMHYLYVRVIVNGDIGRADFYIFH